MLTYINTTSQPLAHASLPDSLASCYCLGAIMNPESVLNIRGKISRSTMPSQFYAFAQSCRRKCWSRYSSFKSSVLGKTKIEPPAVLTAHVSKLSRSVKTCRPDEARRDSREKFIRLMSPLFLFTSLCRRLHGKLDSTAVTSSHAYGLVPLGSGLVPRFSLKPVRPH